MTSQGKQVPVDAGLRQLCLAMRPELRRFLTVRGASEADADDVLQDLFVRLETSVTGPVRSPRAYLYQMVNNMAHTRRRTETRRQARDAAWSYTAPAGEEQPDASPDPETALLARDHLARVEAGLKTLPERTAHVFRQFRIEGVSQKQIALDEGISVSAVEKHLQRAYRVVLDIRRHLEGGSGHTQVAGGPHDPSR